MNSIWMALIVSLATLSACKSVPKNRSDGYVPASLQCPTDTDPNCIGGSTAAVQVPIAPAAAKPESNVNGRSSATKVNRFISGRCELVVTGQRKVQPCEGLRLVVRSTVDNEERIAKFDGYGFKIDDLKEGVDYRVEALADKYDVTTDTRTIKPGQKPKIRVMAKPRL